MRAEIGLLNVGAGDVKISFDKSNVAEYIRAKRIVKDLIRRGYALLIEVDGKYQRALSFDDNTDCYIIADFDPIQAAEADTQEHAETEEVEAAAPAPSAAPKPEVGIKKTGGGRGKATRSVPASGTRGVAVPRSAGG